MDMYNIMHRTGSYITGKSSQNAGWYNACHYRMVSLTHMNGIHYDSHGEVRHLLTEA